jgi:hypothetical protein
MRGLEHGRHELFVIKAVANDKRIGGLWTERTGDWRLATGSAPVRQSVNPPPLVYADMRLRRT